MSPWFRFCLVSLMLLVTAGCATAPPENPHDLCDIFTEKRNWYLDAKASKKRWGVPISVMMAFAYQESSFKATIKPPRKMILGFIPGPRLSNSKGYSQATRETWQLYKDDAGNWGADRDDFGDAIDFIGWYNHLSHERNGISKSDPYHLYLAYHEGHGGFSRKTYKSKQWLIDVAKKVTRRSQTYSRQLKSCQKKLDGGFFRRLFGF
ncbi:MAG: hypothetical protein OEZ23_05805 [Gammaproteobacteria bacterium]|nr:hypothetical protein [Gammaproteobacteria bacterium]